jgi:hypothetical protein
MLWLTERKRHNGGTVMTQLRCDEISPMSITSPTRISWAYAWGGLVLEEGGTTAPEMEEKNRGATLTKKEIRTGGETADNR